MMYYQDKRISLIVSDFDGVMTNNKVYISSEGTELVRCCRSDGLAINYFRHIGLPLVVISSESNPVVQARCNKLRIRCIHDSREKAADVKKISIDYNVKLVNIAYIGNDINDIEAMNLCGMRACPQDSHPDIKKIATKILKSKGGDGVIREFAETMGMTKKTTIIY